MKSCWAWQAGRKHLCINDGVDKWKADESCRELIKDKRNIRCPYYEAAKTAANQVPQQSRLPQTVCPERIRHMSQAPTCNTWDHC
jgi:DEAD_2